MMQDAPPKVVMVHDEPKHHQVFHEGTVTTLYHTHDTAILYVPISISPTDTQILGQAWLGVKPTDRSRFEGLVVASDTTYAIRPLTHRVRNVGDRLFRLIAITNGSPGNPRHSPAPPGTTVHSSPWYAAARLVVDRHAGSEWHTAAMPSVIVLPDPGHLVVEGLQAARTRLDTPGSWSYVERGGRYRIVNDSPAAAAVIIVEANQP